jgi:hypothetical protein
MAFVAGGRLFTFGAVWYSDWFLSVDYDALAVSSPAECFYKRKGLFFHGQAAPHFEESQSRTTPRQQQGAKSKA